MGSRPMVAAGLPSRALALAAVLLLSAGACSSDKKGNVTPTTSKATTTTSASSAVSDPAPAVLADYRRFWDAYLAAADPMNPEHPLLAQHATGSELETLQKAFLASKAVGEVIRGRLDLAPRVAAVDGTEATVTDCYGDHTNVFDAASGVQKDKSSGVRHFVRAKLVLEGGTWKVADLRREGDGCEVDS
ncbi:MAG: hypothetical protein M3P85_05820 [Actinomycetota bacterium]|nr:hypothetical protein [Actinomycetota bacterium]